MRSFRTTYSPAQATSRARAGAIMAGVAAGMWLFGLPILVYLMNHPGR